MPQLLLIVVFLLVHVPDLAGPSDTTPALETTGGTVAWALTPLALLCVLSYLWIRRCTVLMDRAGSWRAAQLGERIADWTRIAAVALHAFNVLVLDWVGAVRAGVGNLILVDELLAVAPVIAAWTFTWWAVEPIERRIHEAALLRRLEEGHPIYPTLTRGRFVWMSFRHGVLLLALPLVILIAWSEVVERFSRASGAPDENGYITVDLWMGAVQLAGVVVIFALMPLVLRVVWDTVPLAEGTLHQRLALMCRACGVRVKSFLVWRTNGLLINGAAVGFLRPLRYIVLTDALLDRLPQAQVEAVAAHEIGHMRRKHMLWLAVAMLATLTAFGGALALAERAGLLPKTSSEGITSNAMVLVALAAGLVVFGFVSRRFEWQADAFAVQYLSGAFGSPGAGAATIRAEAVEAMNGALRSVADLNGIPRQRYSWRHGSIASRQQRLTRMVGAPAAALPIDRQVRVIKVLAAVVLIAGTAWTVIQAVP